MSDLDRARIAALPGVNVKAAVLVSNGNSGAAAGFAFISLALVALAIFGG